MDKQEFIDLKPLTQVAYIPTHANGEIGHPDVQFGFVTSTKPELGTVFVRYWLPDDSGNLRTTGNSEGCDYDLLVLAKVWTASKIWETADGLLAKGLWFGDEF